MSFSFSPQGEVDFHVIQGTGEQTFFIEVSAKGTPPVGLLRMQDHIVSYVFETETSLRVRVNTDIVFEERNSDGTLEEDDDSLVQVFDLVHPDAPEIALGRVSAWRMDLSPENIKPVEVVLDFGTSRSCVLTVEDPDERSPMLGMLNLNAVETTSRMGLYSYGGDDQYSIPASVELVGCEIPSEFGIKVSYDINKDNFIEKFVRIFDSDAHQDHDDDGQQFKALIGDSAVIHARNVMDRRVANSNLDAGQKTGSLSPKYYLLSEQDKVGVFFNQLLGDKKEDYRKIASVDNLSGALKVEGRGFFLVQALTNILWSTYVYINSVRYRKLSNDNHSNPKLRVISRVIATYPPSYSQKTIVRYQALLRTALELFYNRIKIKKEDEERIHELCNDCPSEVKYDEASSSQIISFLRYYHQNSNEKKACNILSLDIGGGTSDVALVQYKPDEGSKFNWKRNVSYAESFFDGGEKLIRNVVREYLVQNMSFERMVGSEEAWAPLRVLMYLSTYSDSEIENETNDRQRELGVGDDVAGAPFKSFVDLMKNDHIKFFFKQRSYDLGRAVVISQGETTTFDFMNQSTASPVDGLAPKIIQHLGEDLANHIKDLLNQTGVTTVAFHGIEDVFQELFSTILDHVVDILKQEDVDLIVLSGKLMSSGIYYKLTADYLVANAGLDEENITNFSQSYRDVANKGHEMSKEISKKGIDEKHSVCTGAAYLHIWERYKKAIQGIFLESHEHPLGDEYYTSDSEPPEPFDQNYIKALKPGYSVPIYHRKSGAKNAPRRTMLLTAPKNIDSLSIDELIQYHSILDGQLHWYEER